MNWLIWFLALIFACCRVHMDDFVKGRSTSPAGEITQQWLTGYHVLAQRSSMRKLAMNRNAENSRFNIRGLGCVKFDTGADIVWPPGRQKCSGVYLDYDLSRAVRLFKSITQIKMIAEHKTTCRNRHWKVSRIDECNVYMQGLYWASWNRVNSSPFVKKHPLAVRGLHQRSLRLRDFDLTLHQIRLALHHQRLCRKLGQISVRKCLGTGVGLFHINKLILHQEGLPFNGPKRSDSRIYAKTTNTYEETGESGNGNCRTERPSIKIVFPLCTLLFFFGLVVGFGAIVGFNDQRRFVRSALICVGFGCAECGVLFLIATGLFPYTWGLPPQWLPGRWRTCAEGQQQQYFPHTQNVSQKRLLYGGLSYYNNYMANVLPIDKQIAVISSLCEGSSIRSIERITGVHRDTIMRLGVKVGQGCTGLMDAKMRNLNCTRLEMDEIWGYVGKKEKHVQPGEDPQLGNVWTFCAIDADTKLVPAFRVSKERDEEAAGAFVADVASRLVNRVQISTDGLTAYVAAIRDAFGKHNVDYGQIIKTYGTEQSVEAQRRYSAPKITESEKKGVFGYPDWDLISTSYVERLNATTRLHVKRLARLTHAFSKKRENFEAAVGLHFAYYNFVRRHNTLRCTPAMAAGVEPSFWSVGELLEAAA